ncbi:DNA primase [Streptomyces hygroscopicus]|uniref:phage major capsid protein n=1 Tax=Streptomyces hygroscopicus TaxID=1912 RepID=UPI0022401CF4|nr:phage major capsid protein [Streptomyces hygroscopicus]MCW7941688.1 DNA primase [Streptomyces hygroscopicus]
MNKREMIQALQEKRAELSKTLDTILETVQKEERTALNDDEKTSFDGAETEIREIDARVKELDEQIRADEAAAEVSKRYSAGRAQVTDPQVYTRRATGPSYFRDLYLARQKGDREALERLDRNNRMVADAKAKEQRAISTGSGAGGEFVPPLWMEQEFVKLARPGRITANLCRQGDVPPGTDSINIPKINTGTATAVQATQNSGVQQTDMATTSVSSPVVTIAGGQTVSLQLIEQSPLSIDEVVLGDLAADYAKQVDTQVLKGTGSSGQVTGMLTLSGTTSVAWTQATPALGGAGGMYGAIANAIQQIHTSRFLPPTAIIMHPRRWAWAEAQSDSTGRPLVVPDSGGAFNAAGNLDGQVSEGRVGRMLGLPVYVDSLIPTNGGAGTNQDTIIVGKLDDVWLWEGQVRAEAFQQTYANQLSVFVRLYNYVAFQAGRYAPATGLVTGTGAVTPAF